MEGLITYFFFILFILACVYFVCLNLRDMYLNLRLKVERFLNPQSEYKARLMLTDHLLTDAEVEIMNVTTFAQICLDLMSEKAYQSLFVQKLKTDVDREALNTLISLGVSQLHARFVCNYFLAQNLKYPGELIVLSSQTPLYKHDFLLPQDRIGLEIYEFWEKNYHEMIADKEMVYCWLDK
jgi:hypothetical protein